MMGFNENSRVKIPAILHLCRLGYSYLPLKSAAWDKRTNIFPELFTAAIRKINPNQPQIDTKRLLDEITLTLDNDDLGKAFYGLLTASSGIKLIDFQRLENNSWQVVTELPCVNGEDEFRPDIVLLVNGLPLVFIEVKKPNNKDGILAERDRINIRFKNKKFRKFINLTQFMIFSNNMEYDSSDAQPLRGAFYATAAKREAVFNYFREEETGLEYQLRPVDVSVEELVLKDTNLVSIKATAEFATNKNSDSPTNRLLTSLCGRERLAFILKYGLAYVQESKGLEKHIMRYPQVFATKAIAKKLDSGVKKGIIWHTQGSGKTALAYFNVQHLTDYFQIKGIIPKFYFIVDRIDLATQAKNEFAMRGLKVHEISSREALQQSFRSRGAIHNLSGSREITVVNIQKFKDEVDVLPSKDYDLASQRVYFLDEVHRSYNPAGSFLASLVSSDREAILIGLTGTPLIINGRKSTAVFGDYIHKYFYNTSIADGYTLRLIREGIETTYKAQLALALRNVEVLKGDVDKSIIYAHPRFVEPMLDYIVRDFVRSRIRFGDHTIGAMVVCDSADQARALFAIFINKYNQAQATLEGIPWDYDCAAEAVPEYGTYCHAGHKALTASLILYDIGSKDERKDEIEAYKEGKIDLLFVYNMLLTGFDAKRLKKLYIGRIIKDHNLLQTLTRVNRPYKDFRYGYVVDFADITAAFKKANDEYFKELNLELGDEMQGYSNLFKSKEEIEADIAGIKEKLFHYDLKNAEVFSQQISRIDDRKTMLEIKKALEEARNLYNLIRLGGHEDLADKLDFTKLGQLYGEACRHLDLLNQREALRNSTDTSNLVNMALENIVFMFRKISEAEMILADEYKDTLRKTREALAGNFDPHDPRFVTLYEELKRLFKEKNLEEMDQGEMRENIDTLNRIFAKVNEVNRLNELLRAKYEQDRKYARIHKRIKEKGNIRGSENMIRDALMSIKGKVDDAVMRQERLLDNDAYFTRMILPLVLDSCAKNQIPLDGDSARFIGGCVAKEYLLEAHGGEAS